MSTHSRAASCGHEPQFLAWHVSMSLQLNNMMWMWCGCTLDAPTRVYRIYCCCGCCLFAYFPWRYPFRHLASMCVHCDGRTGCVYTLRSRQKLSILLSRLLDAWAKFVWQTTDERTNGRAEVLLMNMMQLLRLCWLHSITTVDDCVGGVCLLWCRSSVWLAEGDCREFVSQEWNVTHLRLQIFFVQQKYMQSFKITLHVKGIVPLITIKWFDSIVICYHFRSSAPVNLWKSSSIQIN